MWREIGRKLCISALLLLLGFLLLDISFASAQERMYEISEEELSRTGTLPDGIEYSLISQGGLSGAGGGAGRYLTCSVKINDIEYAVQRIGLNIVVYDNEHSVVVDSVEFNTYDGLGARRKEPSYQKPK